MKTRRPTDAELMVLRILWQEGPSTVRRLHELLRQKKELGYTTVLKTLQVMTEKGIVVRDVSTRSHVYAPAAPKSRRNAHWLTISCLSLWGVCAEIDDTGTSCAPSFKGGTGSNP